MAEHEEKLDSLSAEKIRLESYLSRLPSSTRMTGKFSSGIVSRQVSFGRRQNDGGKLGLIIWNGRKQQKKESRKETCFPLLHFQRWSNEEAAACGVSIEYWHALRKIRMSFTVWFFSNAMKENLIVWSLIELIEWAKKNCLIFVCTSILF